MKRLGKYRGVVSLAVLFVLTPGLVCLVALRRSVGAWIECHRLETEVVALQADSPPAQEASGTEELPAAGRTLFHRLLPLAERYGATIGQYTPYITRQEGGCTLHSDEVVLQGEYIPLLRTMQAGEQQLIDCKTVSLSYRLIAPRNRQQQKQLKLTLVIQYISTP